MPLLIGLLLVVLALIALVPVSLVLRFRMGTVRRRARGWIAAVNLTGFALSASFFLGTAIVVTLWIPEALPYTAAGLAAGAALGVLGLRLTRWESRPDAVYYTPNRWLVLGLTLLVTARILYGFWRGWTTWRAGVEGASWFAVAGVAGSMAAGAVVLGYYLAYWIGVRQRVKRHALRPLRRM